MEVPPRPNTNILLARYTPRRYVRLRRLFALVAVILLAIMYIAARQSDLGLAFIAPGNLSQPHAQIWQGRARAESCQTCHPGLTNATLSKTESALDATLEREDVHPRVSQQEACVKCHDAEFKNLLAGSPHDLNVPNLLALRDKGSGRVASSTSFVSVTSSVADQPIDWLHRKFVCSDCHREHQGSHASIKMMANDRCQACHQQKFHSFDTDHPDFVDYPRQSSSEISFNHRTHAGTHFAKLQESFECSRCHIESANGVTTLVKSASFEKACASCHREPLDVALSDGIVLWQLPNVDTELLQRNNDKLVWPSEAGVVNDLLINPLHRQLLSHEFAVSHRDRAAALDARLALVQNIADLDASIAGDRELIKLVAINSRAVLADIAKNGQAAMKTRLLRNFGDVEPSDYERRLVDRLVSGMPPEIFNVAYQRWFTYNKTNTQSLEQAELPSPFAPRSEQEHQTAPTGTELLTETVHSNFDDQMLIAAETDDLLLSDELEEVHNIARESIGMSAATDPQPDTTPVIASSSDYQSRVHLKEGGWMIDNLRMAIVYVPNGHADPWMQAYAEWLAYRASESVIMPHPFSDTTQVIGRCVECHRVPETRTTLPTADAPLASAWRAAELDDRQKRLVRFSHTPHLKLPQLQSCTECHQLNPKFIKNPVLVATSNSALATSQDNADSYHDRDFQGMKKASCIQCHSQETNVQDCTMCHDYHVAQ